MLENGYLDGVAAHTQPYSYSLFIRFANTASLHAANATRAFDEGVRPRLQSGPKPMDIYRGVFETIAAGDRQGIYTSASAIRAFLHRSVEQPERATVRFRGHPRRQPRAVRCQFASLDHG